jgi:hypothetical protein
MSDDDSFDELLPWQSRQRQIGPDFSDDSDGEPDGRDYDSDDCFSTASDHSLLQDPVYGEFGHATGEEDSVCDDTELPENNTDDGESVPFVAPELPTLERDNLSLATAPRKGRSLADHLFEDNKEVGLLSFDTEHGGDGCGPLQITGQIIRAWLKSSGRSATKDTLESFDADARVFNKYVKPRQNAIWDEHLMTIHGLCRTDRHITNADSFDVVWKKFVEWFNEMTRQYAAVIFVAWNGEKCYMKWMWRLTQAPNANYHLPEKLRYFIDPYRVIDKYTSCSINQTKSHLDSLSLSSVYQFLFEELGGC